MPLLRQHHRPTTPELAPHRVDVTGAAAYVGGKPVSTVVTQAPSAQELAILRAVSYAAVFDFPLSVEEVRRTLPGSEMSEAAVRNLLDHSAFLNVRVCNAGGWFAPIGREDLFERRRRRTIHSRRFLSAHHRTLSVLCAVPFTRLVAISGSLAHLNADDNADLDLFVVTRDSRVWTVALLLVVVAKLLRRRKIVCANFLLDESHLMLDQHDLYTASQVLHLRPVIGHDMYTAFLDANPFVRKWFPNAESQPPSPFPVSSPGRLSRAVKGGLELALWLPAGVIERVSRAAYRWHLRRTVSRWRSPDQVRLEAGCLKLHTNSHRTEVLARFERQVAEAAAPIAADRRPTGVC
jgi:hypothetical protein